MLYLESRCLAFAKRWVLRCTFLKNYFGSVTVGRKNRAKGEKGESREGGS